MTAQPLKSIELCLEIMVVTIRSRNFFSRKSTYICRLVMTSPKIKIAKKLSEFDRATSQIDRNMLRNNGGNNAKPKFFFTKIDLHTSISDDVIENTNCKKISDFDRATSSIDRIMHRNNGGNNAKPQFFSRKSTYICRFVMTSPKIQIAMAFFLSCNFVAAQEFIEFQRVLRFRNVICARVLKSPRPLTTPSPTKEIIANY